MFKKLLIHFISFLQRLVYEKHTLDKINQKLIEPVEGLIIGGVQYYRFVNPADMPEGRFVHFLHLERELTMGIDSKGLKEYLSQIIQANNKGDKSRIGQLAFMLIDTVENCTPLEALYNLACLVYFDKEEDLSCFDADYQARKMAEFKALNNQSFFLATLMKHLNPHGQQSMREIEESLRESQVRMSAYLRLLSVELGSTT
jgi:hypothetical protein